MGKNLKIKSQKIKKLLIANRGEIAVRIIRAAHDLGIDSVAVYSDADAGTEHVRLAKEKIHLPGALAKDTYLNQKNLLSAAKISLADAVHPGYGFLSENAEFAKAVENEGLIFVGPTPKSIDQIGDKAKARAIAEKLKVPLLPATKAGESLDNIQKFSSKVGYPVVIKAVAGGSGRGMRVVQKAEELEEKIAEAKAEAGAAFKNDEVYVEKFLLKPRHIEVQVLGDGKSIVHVGDRECSVQRRHQKIIEEAQAAHLHESVRKNLYKAAIKLASAVKYRSAGTLEFLVDGGKKADSKFYFLEMNTRIQVEHPVTEEISRLDLVKYQLEIANGNKLHLTQKEIKLGGHAIEFRVYAEDTKRDFLPTAGRLTCVRFPSGPGVRVDSWVQSGSKVSSYYDSLLGKITIWGQTREEAISRAMRALDETIVEGVETTLGFHRWMIRQTDFVFGNVDVYWINRNYKGEQQAASIVGPLKIIYENND